MPGMSWRCSIGILHIIRDAFRSSREDVLPVRNGAGSTVSISRVSHFLIIL